LLQSRLLSFSEQVLIIIREFEQWTRRVRPKILSDVINVRLISGLFSNKCGNGVVTIAENYYWQTTANFDLMWKSWDCYRGSTKQSANAFH